MVKLLIYNRSRIDRFYSLSLYGPDESMGREGCGVPVFNEDVACIYIDLDHLIDTCG